MENSTQAVTFVLTMYVDMGHLTYLYFFLAVLLYVSVIFANTVLIFSIYMDRNLHEPMYLFLCSLFVNEIYGSTSLMPCVMVHLLSSTHEISASFCFIQVFNIHSYVAIGFAMLTIMAYDRYVCICQPLHYNTIITKRRVQIVICFIWTFCFVKIGALLSFTINLEFCANAIDKITCDNHLLVELSCSSSARIMSYIHDLVFGLTLTVGVPLCFIFFTYIKILAVCVKASRETQMKALDTCTPQLLSLMSFVSFIFYNLISQRFDMTFVRFELRVFLTLYGLIIQPILNPLIYGLKLSKMRHSLKKLMKLNKM